MKKIFFIVIALSGMSIIQAQNVGIGVPSPQIKFDANLSAIIGTSATLGNQHDGTNRGIKVSFGATVAGDTTEFAGMRVAVNPGFICGNSGDVLFNTWECNIATSREVMRINGDGYVGIGTASPSVPLEIVADKGFGGMLMLNNASEEGFAGAYFQKGGQQLGYIGYPSGNNWINPNTFQLASTLSDMVFSVDADGGHVERMRINTAGNVGIGTDSPNAKLDVKGLTIITGDYVFIDTSLDNSQGNVNIGANTVWSDTKLNVSSNQPVGVYIDGPNCASALWVDGVASKTGSATWDVVSDERLKDHIKPYSDGLAQVLQINPVSFHYNAASGLNTSREYVGVIAQQLQQVAPYMVGKFNRRSDKEEFLKVDNNAMTYMLINAVKEQQAQIDALKEANEKLAAANSEFKAAMEKRLEAVEGKK